MSSEAYAWHGGNMTVEHMENGDVDEDDGYERECECKPWDLKHSNIWLKWSNGESVSWTIAGADKQLRHKVGDRDKWICHICHEPIDREINYPHPMSAVCDHWPVPKIDNGPTILCNLKIAHHRCNDRQGHNLHTLRHAKEFRLTSKQVAKLERELWPNGEHAIMENDRCF